MLLMKLLHLSRDILKNAFYTELCKNRKNSKDNLDYLLNLLSLFQRMSQLFFAQ